MNKIMALVFCLFTACTSNESKLNDKDEHSHEKHPESASLQLNNGSKWKADDATRNNVQAMSQLISDPARNGYSNKINLENQLQGRIDTLVQQCKMKGPEHEALHVWLNEVTGAFKEVKNANDEQEYNRSYVVLQNKVREFHTYFD